MHANKLINDGTASIRGDLHQLWVVVEKCFEMHKFEQKILIETQGDVTGEDQIEVKLYTDSLTDNHLCFWKTLNNWLQDDFNPLDYNNLILLTTQQFGPNAKIKNWNNETLEDRYKIIQAIYKQNGEKYLRTKEKDKNARLPKSLKLQKSIFSKEIEKINSVLKRFFIEAVALDTPKLFEKIKGQYLKGVIEGKKDDFMYSLFGYITQPKNDETSRWEITYTDFTQKVSELISVYGWDTKIFPKITKSITDGECDEHERNRLFVKKIIEIEYQQVIRKAIEHYHITMQIINDEFKKYSVPPQRTEEYSQNLVEQFQTKYRQALRNKTDVIRDSKNLYDDITGCTPQQFINFDLTPISFRNGLLHAEMDNMEKGLKWRLEEDE